ncbi:MAG TPA: PEP-CTERM sorting domain-containing protein, partial [Isosphaeraceae bacterium]|nr:PEP-CTERM sorting domain-containing protein [Isosphaeraceae bacterium]
ITGQWATDDSGGGITLIDGNYNIVGTTSPSGNFTSFTPFTLTGAVTAGLNYLDFVNVNSGGPGGLRVEFQSATVTPEPSSILLGGLGAIGLLIASRRRRKA